METLNIWVDGSPTRIAIVYEQGEKTWMDVRELPIKRTNNQAEYLALIEALRATSYGGARIFSDSQLMVRQIDGEYRIKNSVLRRYCQEARELLHNLACTLTWVPREENRAGQVLERMK